jgi:hypothetical protein
MLWDSSLVGADRLRSCNGGFLPMVIRPDLGQLAYREHGEVLWATVVRRGRRHIGGEGSDGPAVSRRVK